MINVYVKVANSTGEFVGQFENESDALFELAESRNDNDFSKETFKDCYKVVKIDIKEEITEALDQAIIYMRNNPSEGLEYGYVEAMENIIDEITACDLEYFNKTFFEVFSSVESRYDDVEYINNINEHFIRVIA